MSALGQKPTCAMQLPTFLCEKVRSEEEFGKIKAARI
jgi:hypothetical protein